MAAACGSLDHIFDQKPLPDNPSLLQSLSSSSSPWKPIINPVHTSEFTEIFGELHFKESSSHSSSSFSSIFSSSSSSNSFQSNHSSQSGFEIPKYGISNSNRYYTTSSNQKKQYRSSSSFSSMNSESLSLCTEGLGFESCDDVEDHSVYDNEVENRRNSVRNHESKRSRTSRSEFPPPISSIGSSGKPWVCFKSYREDGRFILKEIRIPTQEFLHACREDGRLKLRFIHSESDDEILEGDETESVEGDGRVEGTTNGGVEDS